MRRSNAGSGVFIHSALLWLALVFTASSAVLFRDDFNVNSISDYTHISDNGGNFTINTADGLLDANRTVGPGAWRSEVLLLNSSVFSSAGLGKMQVTTRFYAPATGGNLNNVQTGLIVGAGDGLGGFGVSSHVGVNGWQLAQWQPELKSDPTNRLWSSGSYSGAGWYTIDLIYMLSGPDVILTASILHETTMTSTFLSNTFVNAASYGGDQVGFWTRNQTTASPTFPFVAQQFDYLNIDDMIPEPGTLALLAAGGWLIYVRRRQLLA